MNSQLEYLKRGAMYTATVSAFVMFGVVVHLVIGWALNFVDPPENYKGIINGCLLGYLLVATVCVTFAGIRDVVVLTLSLSTVDTEQGDRDETTD